MNIRTLSVSKLNGYIKNLFNSDAILSNVSVEGEISNFKNHTSGHLYFSLKDKDSRILCVMFKGSATALNFVPEDGKEVVVKGYVTLYEKTGQYQLYVSQMKMKGSGNLYLQFEELKKTLQEKGWFDKNGKHPIPSYPKKIAVVTSETGAALRDIVSVVTRRNPVVELLLYPVLVQGENAKYQIAQAIEEINRAKEADVIILARGGGSIEELWPFNEYLVAESIFHSSIPIISGVGHETDFTIADFVADLRAPTPSAAAEIAVPSLIEIKDRLRAYRSKLNKEIIGIVEKDKNLLAHLRNHYTIRRPVEQLYQYRQQLDFFENRIQHLFKDHINANRVALLNSKSKLNELYLKNKEKTVLLNCKGEEVHSIGQVQLEEELFVRFIDGSIKTKILEINEVKHERTNL